MNWPESSGAITVRPGIVLLVLASGYALGCFTAGYYLVRRRAGVDLRETGSGSAGATNAGRVLGWTGFALTLAVDAAKGAAAMGLAVLAQFDPRLQWLTVAAVVAGHNWPAQLAFRGGKGVAPLLGALLVLDPRILLLVAVLFPMAALIFRRFNLSGLSALTFTPVALLALKGPVHHATGLFLVMLLVLWAHRGNLREDLKQWTSRGAKPAAATPPQNT